MATFWILLYIFIGLLVGTISGILGIGGGVLLVPILMWCGFKYRQATGTSLAVLVPPIGLPAAWKAYQDGYVDLGAALCIASAFAIGAYFGRSVIGVIDERVFRLCFGLFMMFIAMRFIVSGSDESTVAMAGLTASLVSMFAFVALYLLGKHHLIQPNHSDDKAGGTEATSDQRESKQPGFDLGQNIRTSRDQGYTDPDYYI
jgi:hypothetical protein